MAIEMTVPMVQFNKRAIPEGRVDYDWVQENSEDIFSNKRVVVFHYQEHSLLHVVVHIYLDTKQGIMTYLNKTLMTFIV